MNAFLNFYADAPGANAPVLPQKIAVVHDWLPELGGAERVLGEILQILPQAHLYSLLDFLPEADRSCLHGKKVRTSFLQKCPGARRHYRSYLPLMPLAVEHFDLSGYDLVISSSYAVAKGVLTGPDQLHLCYCHSPVRYAWDLQELYLRQTGQSKGWRGFLARALLHYIRLWDNRAPNGVDAFAANSRFIQRRIWKVYRRRSHVIYPPVKIEETSAIDDVKSERTFFMSLGRLVPYKRVDLLVETFRNHPQRELRIVGDGPERKRLAHDLPPNVKLLGRLPHAEVTSLLKRAKALIFAAEEDFGLTPVEAQGVGTPVIAYARGGACESVIPGKTGVYFHAQEVASLSAALEQFDQMEFSREALVENARRFGLCVFRRAFQQWIGAEWARFQERNLSV